MFGGHKKSQLPLFPPSSLFSPSLMAESEASWVDDKDQCSSPVATSPEAIHEPQWTDNVVPPTHRGRNLIVCFDGTGDKFDADVCHTGLQPPPVCS